MEYKLTKEEIQREKKKKAIQEWRERNPEKYREQSRANQRKYTAKCKEHNKENKGIKKDYKLHLNGSIIIPPKDKEEYYQLPEPTILPIVNEKIEFFLHNLK